MTNDDVERLKYAEAYAEFCSNAGINRQLQELVSNTFFDAYWKGWKAGVNYPVLKGRGL